jgi:signal transduction histidine kinase
MDRPASVAPATPRLAPMSEPLVADDLDALQQVPEGAAVSAVAGALATRILGGESTINDAVESVGRLLSSYPGVDLVATVLTQLDPEDTTKWDRLGERAWLRTWSRPGTSCTALPRRDSGVEALTLPWISQLARRDAIVLRDTGLMPPEAEQDVRELAACGIQAMVTRSVLCDGLLFGSVGISRGTPGTWPDEYVADIRLLGAALGSRMSAARARGSLVDAIRRGDLARASQQEFFAAIGHELRTPIAAIVGTAELLGSDARELVGIPPTGSNGLGAVGGPVPAVAEFASSVAQDSDVVLSAGEQLLAIVDDLLDTGQELGGGTESQWVDVADALGDVMHWLRAPALSNEVTVTTEVTRPTLVLTTPSGLRQILTNLVGNAIAYNKPGGSVHVTTSATRDEFGQSRVRIRVRDTGPGLTPEQQGEVFKPFVRFAGPDIRGTGLGLSLSRSLAERDGGMLGVESTPGEGSVFWLDLPAPGDPGR